MADDRLFYVIDMRPQWRRLPGITLWRPNACGYAYPLPWSGLYSLAELTSHPGYYARRVYESRIWERWPVERSIVEGLAVAPPPRMVDGDAGPVLLNNAATRAALRRARFTPPEILAPHDRPGAHVGRKQRAALTEPAHA